MSGLFGGGDSTPLPPTRSPQGVTIVKTAARPPDTILSRGVAAGVGAPSGTALLDDGTNRQGLGTYGGSN